MDLNALYTLKRHQNETIFISQNWQGVIIQARASVILIVINSLFYPNILWVGERVSVCAYTHGLQRSRAKSMAVHFRLWSDVGLLFIYTNELIFARTR